VRLGSPFAGQGEIVELFGIVCSIPVALGMSMVYCAVLAKVVRRWGRLYPFLYIPSLIVLGLLLADYVLLASIGVVRSRVIIGPCLPSAQGMISLLGMPALANLLVLRPISWKWYLANLACTVLAFVAIVLQYVIFDELYGPNGTTGPFS
jgi:hypothetical protein